MSVISTGSHTINVSSYNVSSYGKVFLIIRERLRALVEVIRNIVYKIFDRLSCLFSLVFGRKLDKPVKPIKKTVLSVPELYNNIEYDGGGKKPSLAEFQNKFSKSTINLPKLSQVKKQSYIPIVKSILEKKQALESIITVFQDEKMARIITSLICTKDSDSNLKYWNQCTDYEKEQVLNYLGKNFGEKLSPVIKKDEFLKQVELWKIVLMDSFLSFLFKSCLVVKDCNKQKKIFFEAISKSCKEQNLDGKYIYCSHVASKWYLTCLSKIQIGPVDKIQYGDSSKDFFYNCVEYLQLFTSIKECCEYTSEYFLLTDGSITNGYAIKDVFKKGLKYHVFNDFFNLMKAVVEPCKKIIPKMKAALFGQDATMEDIFAFSNFNKLENLNWEFSLNRLCSLMCSEEYAKFSIKITLIVEKQDAVNKAFIALNNHANFKPINEGFKLAKQLDTPAFTVQVFQKLVKMHITMHDMQEKYKKVTNNEFNLCSILQAWNSCANEMVGREIDKEKRRKSFFT